MYKFRISKINSFTNQNLKKNLLNKPFLQSSSRKSLKTISFILFIFLMLFTFSCKNLPREEEPEIKEAIIISRKLLEQGQVSASQLADFFINQNTQSDYQEILNFAQIYIEEAAIEGINSDIAFAQMCLETGFLNFGGLVQKEWHNYCGLGAIDKDNPGCIFESQQLGVRAHIQHLQAYATREDISLKQELIDPRYNWVHKTKYVETIEGLTGTWATDPQYSQKLDTILTRLENFVNEE